MPVCLFPATSNTFRHPPPFEGNLIAKAGFCVLSLKTLQELEALRCDYTEQMQQVLALRLVVRQIVMILFNYLADTRRSQKTQPPPPPQHQQQQQQQQLPTARDSTAFLNDLLRVLLCDQVVRSALSQVPENPIPASQSKRLTPVCRKSSSNLSGSWTGGSVLEDLEEEDQSGFGPSDSDLYVEGQQFQQPQHTSAERQSASPPHIP
uniref:Uncharacterized protein n=1 Tax=Mesocestoides corti TaxID=53468 RepID=A0A5K3FT69_MESCO